MKSITPAKTPKLKMKFAKKTCFGVPTLPPIRSWTQRLFGTRHSVHSLALAEQPKPCERHFD